MLFPRRGLYCCWYSLVCVGMILVCVMLADFGGNGQNLVPFVPEMGATLCRFLAMKTQLPRNFLRDCDHPTCGWEGWTAALQESAHLAHNANNTATNSTLEQHNHHHHHKKPHKQRIVLSYSHNGFGNQLWEHTVAFMVAEGLKAKLLIGIIPESLCFDGATPPNTFAGMSAMERLLPDEFEYDTLPATAPEKILCEKETFFVSDRPRDWRDKNYSTTFKSQLYDLLADPQPRCLRMIGYFQNYPLCHEDARQLWTPRMFANFTHAPGPNDLSIYLRCLPRHYFFNDKHYYETILNHTSFDRIWLFHAPECPTKLGNDPARDGAVAGVMRLLLHKYNATRWPVLEDLDDTSLLLYDLAGLAQSKKLILPVSSWAFWAGMLSNATEIHVNGPPHHPMMPTFPNYIYHDEKKRLFFGRFNASSYDVDYTISNPLPPST